MRFLIVLMIAAYASAAEPEKAPAATGGYQFKVDAPARLYDYSLKQEVAWESAGDKLSYVTAIDWTFALKTTAAGAERAVISITITSVRADHTGPGSDHHVDSHDKDEVDPLLAPLLAQDGVTLKLTIDSASGAVSQVSGGEQIVAKLNELYQSPTPGVDPPPLDAEARKLYTSENLARWWTGIFALPSDKTATLALNPPLSGEIARQWQGENYTLGFPQGTTKLSAQLLRDPTPLSVALSNLSGKGTVRLNNGYPAEVTGEVSFDLDATALTQPVTQKHRISWKLVELTAK